MKIRNYMAVFIAIAGLTFTSCSDDNGGASYDPNGVEVANAELKKILQEKGFNFNEKGNLLQDEKVQNTTSLDLSNTKISPDALTGLTILPNLIDVNLSNNGYGPVFDFSKLPAKVISVDLQGNDIYDFEGLVDAKVKNDEVQTTIQHKLSKLYLPQSAKWNVEDLMPFYTKNNADGTTVDMQMADDDGKLEAYNTLREIPDDTFCKYLQSIYPSIFVTNEQIDIAKPMKVEEEGRPIYLPYEDDTKDIKTIEGIEYFINNPFYKSFYIDITCKINCDINYLTVGENIKGLSLCNVNTKDGIDLKKSKKLAQLKLYDNKSINKIDLTNTAIAQQKISDFDLMLGNIVDLRRCPNLSDLIYPSSGEGLILQNILIDLPLIKNVDLSFIKGINQLVLILNGTTVTYPTLAYYINNAGKFTVESLDTSKRKIGFTISESILNLNATKTFINQYKKNLRDRSAMYSDEGAISW